MKLIGRKGQTMVEYVLTFSALLVVVGALGYLLKSTRHSVVRTERIPFASEAILTAEHSPRILLTAEYITIFMRFYAGEITKNH